MPKYPEPGWLQSHTEELRREVIELYRSQGHLVPPEIIDRAMVEALSELIEFLYRRLDRQEAGQRTIQLH